MKPHILFHLVRHWGPQLVVWAVSLLTTDLITRSLTPRLYSISIRSLTGFGNLYGPQPDQCSTAYTYYLRLALKLFRGEPAISAFDWNFTPTHISSESFSTLTGSVLHAILPALQPGHGQITAVSGLPTLTSALLRLAFAAAPCLPLNLASADNSLVHSSIGTPSLSLRLLVDIRFQVLFHSPPGVLFTFPSRYFSSIGHQVVFRLGGWSPRLPTGFLVSCGTLDPDCQSSLSTTWLSHCLAGLPMPFVQIPPIMQNRGDCCCSHLRNRLIYKQQFLKGYVVILN